MEYYKFIQDIEEMNRFYNLVLKPKASYELISLSASLRGKLMNAEEKQLFPLNKHEMFSRKVVYNSTFNIFLRTVADYETNKLALCTPIWSDQNSNGYELRTPPQEALRIHVNINNSDGRKIPDKLVSDLCSKAFSLNYCKEEERENILNNLIKRCLKGGEVLAQQEQSIREWADYDIDMNSLPLDYDKFVSDIRKKIQLFLEMGQYIMVSSPNGLHILVRNGSFKTIPKNMLDDIRDLDYDFGEIKRNKGDMIILPGTYAYDKEKREVPIRILNYQDF